MEDVGLEKDILSRIYKNKNVLITGHTGFKGSWLSIWLNSLGANVIGYSLDPYSDNDNFVVTNIGKKIIDIRGDLRDREKLNRVFEEYKPEFVFHLAAQPLVRLSYEMPSETYEINVMGTLNVLECIRSSKSVKVGIMVTTDKCYENKEQIWGYKENDSMGGYDPYSSSKACAELLIASYRNSFFNPNNYEQHRKSIASVRAGNVIGGGDWSKDRIIPDCIRSLEDGEIIKIRNPYATRPWQHVLEPLRGYLLLTCKMYENPGMYCEGWNFGPDFNEIQPVNKVVDYVIKFWGKGKWMDVSNSGNLHEASILSLDCTKAKQFLKWYPKLNLCESLEYTVEWYKKFRCEDAYELCIKQINKYLYTQ